jgi:NAD(P)-dependent dehydrogenase (short-subunit alcohol dehydrogenase family)
MNRVTLLTGASHGIGREIAERLSHEGHTIINLSRSQPSDGFPGHSYAVDLGNSDAAKRTLAEVTVKHSIDNVVNNAGLVEAAKLEEIKMEEIDHMVDLNLRAAILVIQAVAPGMRAKKRGRIVNISSRAALGKKNLAVYGATKAAVNSMTRTLALELARDGITVNAVAPGPVATSMFYKDNPPDSPATKAFISSIPAGRIGTPADIAAAVNFLIGDDASFITGQTLYVCGGLSIASAPMM